MTFRCGIILNLFLLLLLLSGCCCCCSDMASLFDTDSSSDDGSYTSTPVSSTLNSSENTTGKSLKAIIVLCDDYIDPENNKISDGVHVDSSIVKKFLDRLEKRNIVTVERTILQGKKATTSNIAGVIKDIDTDTNDILFFYYSGHGGMTGGETFLWPCDENVIYRKDLISLIEKKDAQLKLVFTDACSSSIDSVGYRNMLNYMGNVSGESNNDKIYTNLFLNYEGLLDCTAATEGQYAFSSNEDGGYFTSSLFSEVLLSSPLMEWNDVILKAREKTEEKFQHAYRMRLFSESSFKDLEERDITNQTPETYSMPDIINKREEEFIPEDKPYGEKTEAIIKNETDKEVLFYVDNNKDNDLWSHSRCREVKLHTREITTLNNNDIIKVFYDKGDKKIDYYKLERGRYYFASDGGLVQLYIGNGSENSSAVIVYNFDYDTVNFSINKNESTEDYALKPNEFAEINLKNSVEIYFNKLSYTLEPEKTYYFAKDQYGKLDLYVSE